MNVIFMGTPDFAVPALKKLILSQDNTVKAVFTAAPKESGRGMKLTKSPVHEIAIGNNIDVFTPKTLRDSKYVDIINSIDADIIVVVAYGLIIPSTILKAKKYGCINIHPSDLPKYRGAAPLQRTIINGEKETAVCIIQIDEGVDTGDIILEKNFSLNDNVTLQELHDDCARIGGDLVLDVLENIDILPKIRQSKIGVTYAPKLTKEEGKINWSDSSFDIDCKIRGMNPWPGAYFEHDKKIIKILKSKWTDINHEFKAGEVINNKFEVACGKGTLIITSLKPEGKKEMSGSDYLRGISFKNQNKIIGL